MLGRNIYVFFIVIEFYLGVNISVVFNIIYLIFGKWVVSKGENILIVDIIWNGCFYVFY